MQFQQASLDQFIDFDLHKNAVNEITEQLGNLVWNGSLWGSTESPEKVIQETQTSLRRIDEKIQITRKETPLDSGFNTLGDFEKALNETLPFTRPITHHPGLGTMTFVFSEKGIEYNFVEGESAKTGNAFVCPETMKFAESLPLKYLSRLTVFVFRENTFLPIHDDSSTPNPMNNGERQLMVIRCSQNQFPFFYYDNSKGRKVSLGGKSFYFDDLQLHGCDGVSRASIVFRIDGGFNKEVREYLIEQGIVFRSNLNSSDNVRRIKELELQA